MRIAIFLFLISALQVIAENSYSQLARLSFDLRNTTIKEVLSIIEEQSDFYFLYDSKLIDVQKKVDISVKNEDIDQILKTIFSDGSVNFLIRDRHIVLTPATQINQQNKTGTITGKVTDSSGAPLPGVTVVLKGTTMGTITDSDGKYSLTKVPGDAILVFSFVGMKSHEIQVSDKSIVNVVMEDETVGIEEVVAIGYGVQKKTNISGSITSVSTHDLRSMATTDASQALQGKIPAYISRNSGRPGESSTIFIRGVSSLGNSSPIWIIDGVPGIPMNNFNEIESIQVLKDAASTAIYGVSGANGVILVTTRKAAKGKMSVNYNGYMKFNKAMNLPDMLNTQGYIDMYKARWMSNNPGKTETDMQGAIKPFYFSSASEIAQLPNTDWVDVMFGNGLEHVHSFDVSGSNGKNSYFISAMLDSDDGTYANSKNQAQSMKSKFEHTPVPWLKLTEIFAYQHSKRIQNDPNWDGIIRSNPAMKVYDDTNPMGTGYGYFTDTFAANIDWQGGNVLESAMMKDYWDSHDSATGVLQAIVTPIKELVWSTTLSGSISHSNESKFNYNTYNGISINSIDWVSGTGIQGKQFEYSQGQSRSYVLSSFVNYNKVIKRHDVGGMVGFEMSESRDDGAKGYAEWGIPAQDLRSAQLTLPGNRDGYNTWGTSSSYAYFGRLTYAYDARYLLTANFRNDAVPTFAPGKRNAFFPSVSFGWNIANESFFNTDKINELKLRVGVGKSGNASVDANLWRQEYTIQTNGTWKAQKVVNPDITWEKTTSVNIGLDISAWNNKLQGSVDLYDKNTRDALLRIALPTSTGFSNYQVNQGEISNKGIEVVLSYRNSTGNLNYFISGNISYNKNEVLNLGPASYLDGGSYNRTYENGPVSALYGYVADGLYQTQQEINDLNNKAIASGFTDYDGNVAPGDIRFKDINNDGTINEGDYTTIGNPWPKYVYGFNINLEKKGIELVMNWQGVADRDVYNTTRGFLENMNADWNSTPDVWNAWSSTNMSSSQPRMGNSTHNYGISNSYLVEDASYLRLKNIQLGYIFDKSITSKICLSSLKVYVSMQNALTFTNFKGFDPEFMSGNNYSRGVYNYLNNYPQSRTFTIGLNVGF
jgi:TonB-linked SusC/RagA family outer membrane protein